MLTDFDENSFYPNIILQLGLYPAHLNKQFFLDILERMVINRLACKANQDILGAENFKTQINAIFGQLSSEGSPIKDEKLLYTVTLNGQLLLLMLTEQLEMIPGVVVKYQNTDGVMAQYPFEVKEKVTQITKEFEKYINIPLEEVPMKAIYMENVSSYIAITENNKVKRKGIFKKIEDKTLKDDSSSNIVAIALEQYFVNNIPIRQTIENHKDIFDFYIGVKKIDSETYYRYAELINGESVTTDYHDKVLRFYVTKQSSTITKIYGSGKTEAVIKGYNTKIAQIHEDKPMDQYKINYNYYVNQCNKIIDKIFLCDSEINFE